MRRARRTTCLLAALAAVLCLTGFAAPARAAKVKGLQFWTTEDSPKKKAAWTRIIKDLNGNLRRAQQVHLYLDACFVGEFKVLAAQQATALDFPAVIGMATTADQKMTFGFSENDRNPPGRLRGTDTNQNYYYSYSAYLTKRVRNRNPVPAAKALHTEAEAWVKKDPDIPRKEAPQYGTAGQPNENLKINAGTGATRTLLFCSDLEDMYLRPSNELYLALKDVNFTSFKYYRHTFAAGEHDGAQVDGMGTYRNWETALSDLKTQLNAADSLTVMVNVFAVGHGFNGAADLTREPGGVPGLPHQGVIVRAGAGSTRTIAVDAAFWQDLAVDVTDLSGEYGRGGPPELFLAVSQSWCSQPVSVSVGGNPLGSFTIPSTLGGAQVEIPIPDAVVSTLIGTYGGQPSLDIDFSLAPGDSFRVGLEDDMIHDPGYLPSLYGVGVATTAFHLNPPENAAVPAAGAAGLVACSLALLLAARARLARPVRPPNRRA